MSIKRKIKSIIKKYGYPIIQACPPLRLAVRHASWKRWGAKYQEVCDSVETQENCVLFSSFMGRSYSDSARAVFEAMLKDERFKDYTFYWEFRKKRVGKYRYLEELPNVKVVARDTKEFYEVSARAKYYITNSRSPEHMNPKSDQVYIQCWHGTPLKRLGHDVLQGANLALNTPSELAERYDIEAAKWSYLVSPSRYTTDRLSSAFGLSQEWVDGHVLELGYPRNDAIVNTCADPEQLSALKARLREELGFPEGKKLLLYAPTWRDNEYKSGVGYVQDVMIDFDMLRDALSDEWAVLFRPHYFIANKFDFSAYEPFVVNAAGVPDINELYCIADAIMTDYSSVFFDYACTKRPLLFYMPDLEEYANDIHGFYLDPHKDLPGPICTTSEEVVDALQTFDSYFDTYGEQYAAFQERFCPHEDGHAAERLIEAVFFGGEKEEK